MKKYLRPLTVAYEALAEKGESFEKHMDSIHDLMILLPDFEILQTKIIELTAQVENLKSAVRAVQSVPKRSGFAVNDPNPKAEMQAWVRLNEVMAATPEQCLREVQAEAGRAGFIEGYGSCWFQHYGTNAPEHATNYSANAYAEKVKAGE